MFWFSHLFSLVVAESHLFLKQFLASACPETGPSPWWTQQPSCTAGMNHFGSSFIFLEIF
jgi:hypothetical protein